MDNCELLRDHLQRQSTQDNHGRGQDGIAECVCAYAEIEEVDKPEGEEEEEVMRHDVGGRGLDAVEGE